MDLNPFQQRAVTTPGHVTVLACPGSGKTRVLSTRAAHLINNHEIGRLCAVTFTRDAASELRTRILESCGEQHTRRIAVGTFHSLCIEQVRRNTPGKQPRIISDGERAAILKGLWKSLAPKVLYDDLVFEIDTYKSKIDGHVFQDEAIEAVYHGYQTTLQNENAVDFADVLLKAAKGMRNGTIKPLPVAWMLVDEGQDIDSIQQEWILAHGRSGTQITLVGDDDQSLYSFRMALGYKGMMGVTEALSSVELTLPVNYRCAPNILDHAAKLIRMNKERANKNIKAHKTVPGQVTVKRYATRVDEGVAIAKHINSLPSRGEWAVLARTNSMLDDIEVSLTAANIPCQRNSGKGFWEHGIGMLILALLRSIEGNTWIGASQALVHCGLSATWLSGFSRQSGSCIDKLSLALETAPDEHAKKKILTLREGMISWQYQASLKRANLAISGALNFIRDNSRENLKPLVERVKENLMSKDANDTLAMRLARLQLAKGDEVVQSDAVQLLTLHSSKGLEFDNVWMVGCEEGNLPHTDASEDEERRLMYVGMTRARSVLWISSSMEEGMESRFIEEAGL